MSAPRDPATASSAPSNPAFFAVALVIPMTLLAALSGMPRYEIAQMTMGAFAAGLAGFALLVRDPGARVPSLARPAGLAWFGAVVLVAIAGLGAVFTGAGAVAGDEVTRYALLALGALLLGAGLGGPRGQLQLAGAVGAVGVVCGAVSVGQLFGWDALPAIPFSTLPDRAPRSFFDDPAVAAAVLAPLSATSAVLAARHDGPTRVLLLAGAVATALAVGVTGQVALAVALAVGLGAAAAVASGRARAAVAAAAVVAVVGLLAAPGAPDDPLENPIEPRTTSAALDYGRGFPWAASAAHDWARDAARAIAVDALPFGAGPGAFAAEAGAHDDNDSAWALAHTAGLPAVHVGPSAALDLAASQGIPGVLAWLLMLGAALVHAVRRGAPAVAVAVGAPVVAAWIAGVGAWGAPLAIVTGLAVGAAASTRGDDDASTTTRLGPARFALALALVAVAAVNVPTAMWALSTGAGHVFAGHGHMGDAIPHYEQAADIQVRFESEAALALLLTLPRDEDAEVDPTPRMRRAVEHFDRARLARPTDARVRFLMANFYARALSMLAESEADAADRRSAVVSALQRAVELDPNLLDAVTLLAQAHIIDGRVRAAHDVLDATIDRPVEPTRLLRVHSELGRLYADRLEDPERALAAYQRALAVAITAGDERRLQREVDFMRIWLETGNRPILDPREHGTDGHGPGIGHNHDPFDRGAHNHGPGGHGHDHGAEDHDGHDHGTEDHDDHDHDHDHDDHDHGADDHDGHDGHEHDGHDHGTEDHGHGEDSP